MMARTKRMMTFTASTEEKARTLLAGWKEDHPTATVIAEHKPVVASALEPTRRHSPKPSDMLVSISIEYDD